jgi:hypothetical protein
MKSARREALFHPSRWARVKRAEMDHSRVKNIFPIFSGVYGLKHPLAPTSCATMESGRLSNPPSAGLPTEPAFSILMTTPMTRPQQPGALRALPNRSTGPRSPAGKARSSMNALKTGIYAKSLIIPGEDPAQLAALLQEYFEHYRPSAPEQRDQIDIMVRATWTLRRLSAAEAQVWIYEMDRTCKFNPVAPLGAAFQACDRTLARLQRCANSTQRNYRDALLQLERLQALDLDPESDPDPAPAPGPALQPDPQPTETKPVTPSEQFVPSSLPPAPTTAVPNPPPYHRPGSRCPFRPRDPLKDQRCPVCFPPTKYLPAREPTES